MRYTGAIGAALLLGLSLAACSNESSEPAASDGDAIVVRAAMVQHVNPATLAIWDIDNNAMADDGGLDPAQLDDATWTSLAEHARMMSAAAKSMTGAGKLQAASADNMSVAEGEVTMAAVQKALDADPEGFRREAAALAAHADKLAAAAAAKDAKVAGDLVAGLDQVCESCHAKYWYPDQQ
jgi:cytochrome c556